MSETAGEMEAERLADSIGSCFSNVSDLPDWMRVQSLGRSMRPLTLIAARAVLRSSWLADRLRAERAEGAREALEEAADAIYVGDTLGQASRAAARQLRARAAAHATQDPT